VLGHGARFVALYAAYEVPFDVLSGQCLDFFQGFLEITFTEAALSGLQRRGQSFQWLCLADGEQLNAGSGAAFG
jgi:hypothetical protein